MKKIIMILLVIIMVGCQEKEYDIEINNIDEGFNLNKKIEKAMENYEIKEEINQENIYKVKLSLFYSSTCPHCHAEIEWLDKIKDNYTYLTIEKYEISQNMQLYNEVVSKMKINSSYVPLTIIGNDYHIGFNNYNTDKLISMIENYSKFNNCDVVNTIKMQGDYQSCMDKNIKN